MDCKGMNRLSEPAGSTRRLVNASVSQWIYYPADGCRLHMLIDIPISREPGIEQEATQVAGHGSYPSGLHGRRE